MPRRAISWGGSPRISLPSKKIFPRSAGSTPLRRLNVVVFPAPLGPMMAQISLRCTLKDRSLNGCDAVEGFHEALNLQMRHGLVLHVFRRLNPPGFIKAQQLFKPLPWRGDHDHCKDKPVDGHLDIRGVHPVQQAPEHAQHFRAESKARRPRAAPPTCCPCRR